ncbi:MAG: hypothetical protein ABJF23_05875, partial [Bryobacteraceae bacterium]
TINRLEEGDTLLYRPILGATEKREGEVTIVLVPAHKDPSEDNLVILDPKAANKPQNWTIPMRVSVVAFVYGPAGLNRKKVKNFLARDEELVSQLADYAEKTAQTEALIAALSSPNSSSASVQSALSGFSSQYGLSVQLDKGAPVEQQALALFRTLNPAIASYDPISPQRTQQYGQTARLATSVAALFFGSPVGLAAGGTAMLMEMRSLAFPKAEFRSSFAQALPQDGLGLCGRRDPAAPHTKVAYLWASRVPNAPPPQMTVDKLNSVAAGVKSTVQMAVADSEWKFTDRAHSWELQAEDGKQFPIHVQKLGDSKMLELDTGSAVKPGTYRLIGRWDWDPFAVKGAIEVRPLSDLSTARLTSQSQDLLVARTGKVPLTLEGTDFEFVTKVNIQKLDDKFDTPSPIPFVLPRGLRKGPQDRMDIQVNTIDLDPGQYALFVSQVDGKAQKVDLKILPAPPRIDNFPVVLNKGSSSVKFELKGQRLDLLSRLEVASGKAELGPPSASRTSRQLTLHMATNIDAGTGLAAKAFIRDRSEPLTFADAVRIVGPRPRVVEARISTPPGQDVELLAGELPGGVYVSAMLRVEHLQSNSVVKLDCEGRNGTTLNLHLGERVGPVSLQQLAPDQVFLSFDTGVWLNGCTLQATVANGSEGESEPQPMGRIVRIPRIESFDIAPEDTKTGRIHASLTGQNLETIEKTGWGSEDAELVEGLPLPVPGEGQKQSLQVHLPPASEAKSVLFVWLRGENRARAIKVPEKPGVAPGSKNR